MEAAPRGSRTIPFGSLAKWGAALVALAFLGHTLSRIELARVAGLVGQSGPWVALGLAPYALALLLDALAWRTLIAPLGRPSLLTLTRVRLRCDAFGSTLPGGTLLGESAAPAWLRPVLPTDAGVAAVAGRKCVVGLAEGVYLLVSFALGFQVLHARAAAMPWVVLVLGLFLLAMFGGITVSLASGSVAARLLALLGALPIRPLRAWTAGRARAFASTDARLTSLFQAPHGRLLRACALSLGSWMVETLEAWLLLRLVGVELPIVTVLAFEASVSLLRSLGAFSPGGLGVQDVGYVAALGALGVPDPVTSGGAFIVLKRAKEMVWTLAGFASFVTWTGRARGGGRFAISLTPLREARS